jgi:two-component system alkaline phosphatase synthesis response regulator PhoP
MPSHHHKILIVDDEKFILKMYQTKLEQASFDVLTANNGQDGFKIAHQEKPELIILDVVMNKQDGFVTLKRLKKDIN